MPEEDTRILLGGIRSPWYQGIHPAPLGTQGASGASGAPPDLPDSTQDSESESRRHACPWPEAAWKRTWGFRLPVSFGPAPALAPQLRRSPSPEMNAVIPTRGQIDEGSRLYFRLYSPLCVIRSHTWTKGHQHSTAQTAHELMNSRKMGLRVRARPAFRAVARPPARGPATSTRSCQ